MPAKGTAKGRKIGRNARRPAFKKWKIRAMTMDGMMGRKIRSLMRHNAYTQEQATRHWLANRRRGRVGADA